MVHPQLIGPAIVGNVNVHEVVVIEISTDNSHPSAVGLVNPCGFCTVGEGAIPIVVVKPGRQRWIRSGPGKILLPISDLAHGICLERPINIVRGEQVEFSVIVIVQKGGRDCPLSIGKSTGELSVDSPAGKELTSINITSAGGMFIGNKPGFLDGAFDNFATDNIFKATFGGSFGDISFGNVLPAGMDEASVAADLSAVGSLAGGGDLGEVDLISFIPEPSTFVLMAFGLFALATARKR